MLYNHVHECMKMRQLAKLQNLAKRSKPELIYTAFSSWFSIFLIISSMSDVEVFCSSDVG